MLDAYQHFLWVVELGSFTAASRRAHLSQPALSASIKKLEEAHGAALLHRHARGARPTAAGEALLPRARAILNAVRAGKHDVAEVQGAVRGEVRIGGGATACTYWLPPILAAFRRQRPGVTVRLTEVFSRQVADAVTEGRLDLGIGDPSPDLPSDPWRDDGLVLVADPDFASELDWRNGQLAPGTPVVTFPVGSSLRAFLDGSLSDVEVVMEVRSFGAVKGLVRAGTGVALLSRSSVENDVAEGRLVEIGDPRCPLPRPMALMRNEPLSPAAEALRSAILATPAASSGRARTA